MSRHLFARIAPLLAAFWLVGCTSHHTRPITDARGDPVAGSIATLEAIKLGGVEQWILIRGANTQHPLLLKLHGGPGQAEMATVGLNSALEQDFVVIEWDQRGAGKSAASIEPTTDMNMERIVADTVELTEYLLRRFKRSTLILVGHSWGSAIGLQAVQRQPGLYQAFVSTGQMANFPQAMVAGHRLLSQEAGRRGDTGALARLQSMGVPPYVGPDSANKRDAYVQMLEQWGYVWHSPAKFDRIGWMLASPEYAWPEKLRFPSAAERSFELLLPDLLKLDMTTKVPKVDVPVYFAIGRHDLLAPAEVSQAYFNVLSAPQKHWVWFEGSAHFPQWEEPQAFHDLLKRRVLPETQRR